MKVEINPIYETFFPSEGAQPNDWTRFDSYEAERTDFSKPDFSITEERTWQDTAKTIAVTLLKIILFPWGIYEVVRGLVDRVAMLLICPAQIRSTKKHMKILRGAMATTFQNPAMMNAFLKREVVLKKNGQTYSGFLIGKKETIANGKWALFSPGNMLTVEEAFLNLSTLPFLERNYNLLMINGPGVGMNKGFATVDKMGEAQDVAISFLEGAVKAKRIVLSGQSLGGAAMGSAILKHTFVPEVQYLGLRYMTFDRLSHIARDLHGWLAGKAVAFLGMEMDSVAASKKLQEANIHEVVIQAENDEVMALSGLLTTLQQENLMDNKTGHVIAGEGHCHIPAQQIKEAIQRWDPVVEPEVQPA